MKLFQIFVLGILGLLFASDHLRAQTSIRAHGVYKSKLGDDLMLRKIGLGVGMDFERSSDVAFVVNFNYYPVRTIPWTMYADYVNANNLTDIQQVELAAESSVTQTHIQLGLKSYPSGTLADGGFYWRWGGGLLISRGVLTLFPYNSRLFFTDAKNGDTFTDLSVTGDVGIGYDIPISKLFVYFDVGVNFEVALTEQANPTNPTTTETGLALSGVIPQLQIGLRYPISSN